MSCGAFVAQIIDHLEGGGAPVPVLFSGLNCTGATWPPDFTFVDPTFKKIYTRNDVCSSARKADCPVPVVRSMVLSPNLRIEFHANDLSQGESVPARLPDRIQEFGQLNLYGDKLENNVIKDMGSDATTAMVWNSAVCARKGEDVCEPGVTDGNCLLPPIAGESFAENGKLLRSMVSCNSPFYPSFLGVNVERIFSGESFSNQWPLCRVSDIDGHLDTSQAIDREGVCDYTVTNGRLSIETAAYVALRNNRPSDRGFADPFPRGMTTCPGNLNVVPGSFAQACSCIANADEALSRANVDFKQRICPVIGPCTGDCRPGVSGGCVLVTGFLRSLQSSCTCGGDVPRIEGSVKSFKLTLVDGDREVDFETLQSIWCKRGVSIAGVPIQRYTPGTETCDAIMRRSCLDSGRLINEPEFLDTCECILEEKKLQAQFAGVDVPSHCFTAVCSTNRAGVYRSRAQTEGCSAKICSQTLAIHGNGILMQGFQEVVCNGTVFNLDRIAEARSLEFDQGDVDVSSADVRFDMTFFLVLGVMTLFVVLALLWGIRTLVIRRRSKTNMKKLHFSSVFLAFAFKKKNISSCFCQG